MLLCLNHIIYKYMSTSTYGNCDLNYFIINKSGDVIYEMSVEGHSARVHSYRTGWRAQHPLAADHYKKG